MIRAPYDLSEKHYVVSPLGGREGHIDLPGSWTITGTFADYAENISKRFNMFTPSPTLITNFSLLRREGPEVFEQKSRKSLFTYSE